MIACLPVDSVTACDRLAIFHSLTNTSVDLDVEGHAKCNRFPLHHVTYILAKFEVATFNGLREDTITKNVMDGGMGGRQTDFCTK